MSDNEKKEEDSSQIFKLFLTDLNVQLIALHQILQDLQRFNFIQYHYLSFTKICYALIAASKIVQLLPVESLIQDFENYLTKLHEDNLPLTDDQKDIFQQMYLFLNEMGKAAPKELAKYIEIHENEWDVLRKKLRGVNENLSEHKSKASLEAKEAAWPVIDKKMIELFKIEIDTQIKILSEGLLAYQSSKSNLKLLEPLMRSAHSIKGAARVFSFDPIVQLSHVIEDCFVLAQEGKILINDTFSVLLFKTLDALGSIINVPDLEIYEKLNLNKSTLLHLVEEFKNFSAQKSVVEKSEPIVAEIAPIEEKPLLHSETEKVLRVTARNLNRLMALAAESMVETRWLRPFCDALMRLKVSNDNMFNQLESLRNSFSEEHVQDLGNVHFQSLRHSMLESQSEISERVADLEMFISRHSNLTDRLYSEVIESRMRPFSDGVDAFPRMVWESARRLKKKARLEIVGKATLIDRDILEKLQVPLSHLLRNAIDHGIEDPDERLAKGKLPEGVIRLEASHKGGMLSITVSDDGRGVNLDELRKKIVQNKKISAEKAALLSEKELLDFMFLPGYSTSKEVTELSGRGMGLNIVQTMLQDVLGTMHVDNHFNKGISFSMQLPVTLSVLRALIVKINHGIFAFPLARLEQTVLLPKSSIELAENREYFTYQNQNVGLILGAQVLGFTKEKSFPSYIPVVILRDGSTYYGLVVDEFLGEKELVLQDLESTFGKIPCVLAGSVLENGDPILIIDIEDAIVTIGKLLHTSQLHKMRMKAETVPEQTSKKRILVVDDSISVREVECRLLRNKGYIVDSAVNGADAWNAIRTENYDLVVTDVDMPRMNGIELVRNIKKDARLKNLPVMIVSYKEGENDRLLGLEVGASYYLSKSTFGDESLINAVFDLIGDP